MVVRERTVRVHASIPVSQADALKALAAASGVPLARAVHYAVERLLDLARREGALAVTGGLAPGRGPEAAGDSVAEVAEALDLRVPEAAPESRDGVPSATGTDPDSDRLADPPVEQPAVYRVAQPGAQDGGREGDHRGDRESARGTDPVAASPAAPCADPAPAPAA